MTGEGLIDWFDEYYDRYDWTYDNIEELMEEIQKKEGDPGLDSQVFGFIDSPNKKNAENYQEKIDKWVGASREKSIERFNAADTTEEGQAEMQKSVEHLKKLRDGTIDRLKAEQKRSYKEAPSEADREITIVRLKTLPSGTRVVSALKGWARRREKKDIKDTIEFDLQAGTYESTYTFDDDDDENKSRI